MGLGALMWALALASPAHAADDQIDSFAISKDMQPMGQRPLYRDPAGSARAR